MNKRILIVDDDSNIRTLMRSHLTHCGYDVFESENGAKALAWLNENPADLAIVDVVMPEMNGAELSWEINRRFPTVTILAMSAGKNLVSKELCLHLMEKLGATETIAKPFDLEDLAEKVHSMIRKQPPFEKAA